MNSFWYNVTITPPTNHCKQRVVGTPYQGVAATSLPKVLLLAAIVKKEVERLIQPAQRDIMIQNPQLTDVNPLICGEEYCEPSHSFGPASREYYLLHYVFSGKGEFYTDRGSYEVHKGEIFVVAPNENTFYMADSKTPWHYAWVGFETSSAVIQALFSEDVLPAAPVAHIFQSMLNCDLQLGREWFICGKIYELCSQLFNNGTPPLDRAYQYVQMAQNYIESNYVQELRVDMLAQSLNLNRSYFSRIFKQYTGKSPQQYIVDFRLEKAAELLAAHNVTPGEAARQVGYSDIFNFSRMFRRRFGVPPSRYALPAEASDK